MDAAKDRLKTKSYQRHRLYGRQSDSSILYQSDYLKISCLFIEENQILRCVYMRCSK